MPPTDIIDIYPLTPMQQGMLFHTLFEPTASIYTGQWTCLLTGPLDEHALRAAWDGVVARHDALRTSFVWQGLAEPMQVVHATASVPFTEEDWRDRPPEQQAADLDAFLAADRDRPFDLARPPLQRVALLRVADDAVRLVWTFHHLLLDGWCQGVVLAELVARYDAAVSGGDLSLPPVPQFRDYIAWLAGRDAAADEKYWRESLAGLTGATPLGIDRGERATTTTTTTTEPAEPSYAYVVLDEARTAAVQAAAQQLRVTTYRMLEAALAVVLHRYSGDDDVVYGLTVSGRPPEMDGVDGMVGMLINTVPARVRVDGDATVADWVRALHAEQAARQPHEHAALTDVQSWSPVQHPDRLFNMVLVPQYPTDFGAVDIAGLAVSDARLLERTNYSLTLVSFPGTELTIAAAYDPTRFDDELVEQLVDHVAGVLDAMAADTGRLVGSLPVMTAAEEQRVLHEWNRTDAPYPDQPLHVLFERQAARSPEAVAVVAPEGSMTYAELDARANQLAHRLRSLGVGVDVPVGICTDRSSAMVVAILGVLKAGGAYAPLDALLYPPDRLAFMVRDSRAPVVVVQGVTGAALPAVDAQVVRLDAEVDELAGLPTDSVDAGVGLDDLAYIIYTSGSTGMPKGVLVPHRGLANLSAALDIIKVTPQSRVLQFAPYSFDISVGDVLVALTSGATLCLATLDSLLSPEALLDQLRTQRITNIQVVPSILSTLPVEELPDLETILVGAEICPAELVARWAAPGRRFLNVYGPTETTICASYMECTDPSRTPPIGKPIPNGRIYVLDPLGRPTPIGVPGEITIGGIGVARGYLDRPDLTERAFVADPFSPEPGARMYRSGDRGRWLPDGNLEFLGRMDDQVKVRGHRIELGEVEAALAMHDDVRECAVAAHGEGAERRLVAYVVGGVRPPIPSDLREHLQRQLPDYMVPSAFLVLEGLPRLPNAKVDRAALPDPEGGRTLTDELVEPRDQLEEALAAIWCEVLGLPELGVTDNFFELGGHSLSAARLIGMVEASFGRSLPLVELFESPTVERMAAVLRAPDDDAAPQSYYAAGRALDLSEEAILDPGIQPRVRRPAAGPRRVLLTGATNFVGAFVLDELLRRSDVTVACLVAAPSAERAMERLVDVLSGFGLSIDEGRVEAVPGSLTQPLLGMDAATFASHAADTDVVLHLGEVTDFEFLPYTALRSTNVSGVVEALRLASEGGAAFHLLSTLSAVPLPEIVDRGQCPEDEATTWADLPSGYAQSKWVAERLVREAGRRGLDVAIHRVGEVMGHSRTGVLDPTSTTTRTILSSIEMGQVLAVDLPIVATPIDFVAAALAHLALDPSSSGRTFNLTDLSPEPPPTPRQIGTWLQELGFPVKLVSPLRWRRTVAKRVASGDEELLLAAEAMAGVNEPGGFAGRTGYFLKFVRDQRKWARAIYACDNARAALLPAGITCPRLGPELLARYIDHAAERNLLSTGCAVGAGTPS